MPTVNNPSKLTFPKGFLWGAATSALQVEGNLIHSDWWEWEQRVQPPNFRSGLTCNHYNLYKEDFALAKKLGHNATRFSLEWSRIQPEENTFDLNEINHYRQVLRYLKSLNIKVCLTLHHFSNPLWFAKKGGWANLKAADYFAKFVSRIVPEFKDDVDLWITINEPMVYIYHLYINPKWPGTHKSTKDHLLTLLNMIKAHQIAYHIIHEQQASAQVGIANNLISIDVFHHHLLRELFTEWFTDLTNNHLFYLLSGKTHDFLGLNYYFHRYIDYHRETDWTKTVNSSDIKHDASDLGWEVYPEGIFDVLTDLSDYHLPIYITENGIAAKNDQIRIRFLVNYLMEVHHAIKAGADVRGYFHWTLLDNMELEKGFDPKFGLIDVDFKTFKRTPKPSAYVYQEIIKHNGIPSSLL